MKFRYGPNKCPVCAARIYTTYCTYTCREAAKHNRTRADQLAVEMSRRPWTGKLYFSHQVDLLGPPELRDYRSVAT